MYIPFELVLIKPLYYLALLAFLLLSNHHAHVYREHEERCILLLSFALLICATRSQWTNKERERENRLAISWSRLHCRVGRHESQSPYRGAHTTFLQMLRCMHRVSWASLCFRRDVWDIWSICSQGESLCCKSAMLCSLLATYAKLRACKALCMQSFVHAMQGLNNAWMVVGARNIQDTLHWADNFEQCCGRFLGPHIPL